MSRFAADIARIASGSVAAQALALAAAPWLTRLFPPSAFGEYALFLSIVAVITVFACARYELAITLPDGDREAVGVLALALCSALLVSALSSGVLLAAAPLDRLFDGSAALTSTLWLLPPTVFCSAATLALTYWSSRLKQFGRIGVAHLAGALAAVGWQIGAGLDGRTSAAMLIAGSALGQAVSAVVLSGSFVVRDRALLGAISAAGLRAAAVRYRRFPLYSLPAAIMNNVSWQTPVFMLGALYTPAVAGFYSLSHRVLRLPMHLMGRSLSQVFYQRASVAAREGTLAPLVERMIRGLTTLALLPSLLLALVGRDLFVVAFGAPWAEAGVFVQILSLWTLVWFVSSPLSTIFSALERQPFDLWLNAGILTSRIAALGIGAWLGGPRLALALFAVSGVLVYGYLLFAIASAASLPARRVLAILGAELVRCLPLVVPVAAAVVAGLPALVVLGLAALAGAMHVLRAGTQVYRMTFRHG